MADAQKEKVTLPVLATVKAAYGDVFGNFAAFLKIVWVIWLALLIAVELPALLLGEQVRKELAVQQAQIGDAAKKENVVAPPAQEPAGESMESDKKAGETTQAAGEAPAMPVPRTRLSLDLLVASMILNLVQVALIFCFSVAWYRQLLLHEEKGRLIGLRFGKREWNFGWTSVKAGFALAPLSFILFGVVMANAPGAEVTADIRQQNLVIMVVCLITMLYVQARLSLAYALTVMGENKAPIARSWELSRGQSLRLMAGNLLTVAPISAAVMGFVYALSWGITQMLGAPAVPGALEQAPDPNSPIMLAFSIFMKAVGALFTLLVVATLSAFQARSYAYLLRASAPPAANDGQSSAP